MSILDYIEKIKQENEGPRITAQEPRNMYAGGQLVQNTADGSRPGYSGRSGRGFYKTKVSKFSKLPKSKQGLWKYFSESTGLGLSQKPGESYPEFSKRVKKSIEETRAVSTGEKFADWLKTNYGDNKKITKRMSELISESGIEIEEATARAYLNTNNKSLANKIRTKGAKSLMPEGKGVKELWDERYKVSWEDAGDSKRQYFKDNYKSILDEKAKLKKGNYISADELIKTTGLNETQLRKSNTALGRYISKFLKPVQSYKQHVDEAGQARQVKYYKKPTEIQLNKLTEFTGPSIKLRQKTVDLINELYPKYRSYYRNGELPPLEKVLEAFPNKTAHSIGFAEIRIAQMLDGATFPKDPELMKIAKDKNKAMKLFEAFDKEPWGTPRATGIRSVAMGAIESKLGYEAGTIDNFKQEIRRVLKQHNLPIYDPKKKYSKHNFGFHVDEFASMVGSGRSKAPEFSQFINFAEGRMNMGAMAQFQKEFNKTRDALEANPKNMTQELKKFKKIRDSYVQTLGVDLADIKPGLASEHYSKEFLEEAKKSRNVGRRTIPGIDLQAASKRVGHTVVVPKEYRTFAQALEKKNRPTLTKNIKQLKEGVMKFFGEYDEKKAFKEFYKYMDEATPSQIKRIMKFIPKIAQADDISDRRYASADNIMTDATYVDDVEENWFKRNPKTVTAAAATPLAVAGAAKYRKPLWKAAKKIGAAAFGPTAAAGLWYGFGGVDLKDPWDRGALAAEALLAPTLVKGTEAVTKGIKNPVFRNVSERALNLLMPLKLATKVARVASPIGLLSLAGEGIYHAGKKEMAKRAQMSPEELDAYMFEKQSRGWSKMSEGGYMGGDIVGIRKPHAIPPERQGLRSIMINGKKS